MTDDEIKALARWPEKEGSRYGGPTKKNKKIKKNKKKIKNEANHCV